VLSGSAAVVVCASLLGALAIPRHTRLARERQSPGHWHAEATTALLVVTACIAAWALR